MRPATPLLSLLLLGCRGDGPKTHDSAAPAALPAPVTTTVTGEGARIEVPGAAGSTLRIDIPADAVYATTEVTVTPVTTEGDELVGFTLEPPGMVLRQQATVTLALEAPPPADTFLLRGDDADGVAPTPTTVTGTTLTARWWTLGGSAAEEDGSGRRARDGAARIAASPLPCGAREQIARNKLTELVNAPSRLEVARQTYAAAATVLEDEGCRSAADRLRSDFEGTACEQWDAAVAHADATTSDTWAKLQDSAGRLLSWHAVALAVGADCSLAELDPALPGEFGEYLVAVNERLGATDAGDLSLVHAEAFRLHLWRGDLLAMGLDLDESLYFWVLDPMMERLRAGAHALAREDGYSHPQVIATRTGFPLGRQIVGLEPDIPEGPIGLVFPYADADVHDDIQYANAALRFSSALDSLDLGGGDAPGQQSTAGALAVEAGDTVTVSGAVHALTCWNGDALPAGDRLVVALDGGEVATRTVARTAGDFFADDLHVDVDSAISGAGQTFEVGSTYELTIERQRDLAGDDRELWCSEHLLGPLDHTLFTVTLEAVGAQGDADTTDRTIRHRTSYLRQHEDDGISTDPVSIRLGNLGVRAGDEIEIWTVGDYIDEAPDSRSTRTGAVFSSSEEYLYRDQLHRIPGAIDAGEDIVTPTHWNGDATDIPEDFEVPNGESRAVTVTIPRGATTLFFGTIDSWYDDNAESDGFRAIVRYRPRE